MTIMASPPCQDFGEQSDQGKATLFPRISLNRIAESRLCQRTSRTCRQKSGTPQTFSPQRINGQRRSAGWLAACFQMLQQLPFSGLGTPRGWPSSWRYRGPQLSPEWKPRCRFFPFRRKFVGHGSDSLALTITWRVIGCLTPCRDPFFQQLDPLTPQFMWLSLLFSATLPEGWLKVRTLVGCLLSS